MASSRQKVKLLLNETIKSVGKVGDVVDVSPGYARNYLLPKGLAVTPTPNNVKHIEARRIEIERIERERRDQQAAMITQLATVEVTLERKANEQGNLFGSVTATDIAKARCRPRDSISSPATSTFRGGSIASIITRFR